MLQKQSQTSTEEEEEGENREAEKYSDRLSSTQLKEQFFSYYNQGKYDELRLPPPKFYDNVQANPYCKSRKFYESIRKELIQQAHKFPKEMTKLIKYFINDRFYKMKDFNELNTYNILAISHPNSRKNWYINTIWTEHSDLFSYIKKENHKIVLEFIEKQKCESPEFCRCFLNTIIDASLSYIEKPPIKSYSRDIAPTLQIYMDPNQPNMTREYIPLIDFHKTDLKNNETDTLVRKIMLASEKLFRPQESLLNNSNNNKDKAPLLESLRTIINAFVISEEKHNFKIGKGSYSYSLINFVRNNLLQNNPKQFENWVIELAAENLMILYNHTNPRLPTPHTNKRTLQEPHHSLEKKRELRKNNAKTIEENTYFSKRCHTRLKDTIKDTGKISGFPKSLANRVTEISSTGPMKSAASKRRLSSENLDDFSKSLSKKSQAQIFKETIVKLFI